MRLSGLSAGMKQTVLIIISILFIFIPRTIQTQETRLREFNEKGMETGLRYGENIREDAEWREFSQNVKIQMQAGWEAQAFSAVMESLGLAPDEAATNGVFLKARADWEAKADRKIEEMYGKWLAKKDWSFQVKGGEIRRFIIENVWSKKDDISNIPGNIEEMLKRVETNWGSYLGLYEGGLSDYLDSLKAGAGGLSDEARMNYIAGLEETARAQLEAASGLAGQFIKLEEDKYCRYMNRLSQYRTLIQNSNFIFDGLSSSNLMASEITNALAGVNGLSSPLSSAITQILALQSNAALIADLLAVPANDADTLTVGIKDWQDMVTSAYKDGVDRWDSALSNLLEGMNAWGMNAAGGYISGYAQWSESLDILIKAKTDFQARVYDSLLKSQAAWSDKINSESSNLYAMIGELSNLAVRNIGNFNSYESGLIESLGTGALTLGTINENINWISAHLASDPSLSGTLSVWTKMRDDLTAGIINAKNDLYAQLYSGTPGTGLLTRTDNPDIYLMSDTEMLYESKLNELIYLKQNLDIANAVMDYALSSSSLTYSAAESAALVGTASNNYETALDRYAASTNGLESISAAVKAAASGVSYYTPLLQDAGTNLNAAEILYDISHSNYNAYVGIQSNLDYLTAVEYSNLTASNGASEAALSAASSNYYSILGQYYASVSNYNILARAEEAQNQASLSNYALVRESLGVLEWAMMPGILGVEENPHAAVSAADAIDPVRDYNEALLVYNDALAEISALSNQIAAEAVLPSDAQSKLGGFASAYSAYGAVLDAMQAMSGRQESIARDAQDSWFNIDKLSYLTYHNNFDSSDYYDGCYNSVISNILSGNITTSSMRSMLSYVLNNYTYYDEFSWINGHGNWAMTSNQILDGFYHYTNTAYEGLYRLAFGIGTNGTIDTYHSIMLYAHNGDICAIPNFTNIQHMSAPNYNIEVGSGGNKPGNPCAANDLGSFIWNYWDDLTGGGHVLTFYDPSADMMALWNGALLTNRMYNDYAIDVSQYTNETGIDASKIDAGFLGLLSGAVSDFTGKPVNFDGTFLNAEKGFIAENISVSDGKTGTLNALQVIQAAYNDYLSSLEAGIRASVSSDKLYLASILGVYSNTLFQGNNTSAPLSASISTASFSDAARRAGDLAQAAYGIAENQASALQQDRWGLIIANMTAQADSEANIWAGIFTTGTAQWDSTLGSFQTAMADWETKYLAAWDAGTAQWNAKTNSLVQRKNAWMNAAVNVVSYGSADYIAQNLGNAMDDSVARLLSGDLPDDVNKAVINKAAELRNMMMPKNSAAYLDFFNSAVAGSRIADVKFVIGGVEAYTGDSSVLMEFNSEMAAYKKSALDLEIVKMKDSFANNVRQTAARMNMNIDRSDRNARYNEFAAMIAPQGWGLEGSVWVKKDVTVDSSLVGGDKKESFGFSDYYSYTNRLNESGYTPESLLDKINGDQTAYNTLMAEVMDGLNDDYSKTMAGLYSHIGSESYTSSGEPSAYSGDTSRGELYRITWAMSYYGYKEQVGQQKANASVFDKPIWDSSATGGFALSLGQVGKIGFNLGLACIPGINLIGAAAISAGIAMAGDVVQYSGKSGQEGMLGLALLKDAIGGAAGIATGGLPAGNFGFAMLGAGINTAANIGVSGLKLNADGKMDWQMDKSQWAMAGVSAAASIGQAAFNTGLNWDDNTKIWQMAGNFGITASSSFLNKGFKLNANGQLDWQLDQTKGEWTEAMLDTGATAAKSGIAYGMEGYTGYGTKQNESFLAYGLTKSLEMSKYGMYQSGWFGDALKDKYANQTTFDLAGGLDLTALDLRNNMGYGAAMGIRITTKGLEVHSGAGEFGGLAIASQSDGTMGWNFDRTWKNTMDNFSAIGNGIGAAFNAIGSSISWLGQQTMNIADAIASTLPFGKNTKSDKALSAMMDNMNATTRDLEKPKVQTESNTADDYLKKMVDGRSTADIMRAIAVNDGDINTEKKIQTAQKGDTLSAIAEKNGLSLKELIKLNPQLQGRENYIQKGEIVNLDPANVDALKQYKPTTAQKMMSRYIGDMYEAGQNLSVPVSDVDTMYDYKINGPQLKSGTPIRDQINKIPFVRTIAFGLESIADGIYSTFANGLNIDDDGNTIGLFGKNYTAGEDARNRQNSFITVASLPLMSQHAGIYALSGISSIGLIETATDGQPLTLKKAEMMTLQGLGAIPLAGAMVNRYGTLPYLIATKGFEDGLSVYNSFESGTARLNFGFGGQYIYKVANNFRQASAGEFASLDIPATQVEALKKFALDPKITTNPIYGPNLAKYLYQAETRTGLYIKGVVGPQSGPFTGGYNQVFYNRYPWQKTPWQNMEYIGY